MNVPALMATYQLRQREYLLRITRAMTSRLDLPRPIAVDPRECGGDAGRAGRADCSGRCGRGRTPGRRAKYGGG